MSVTVVMPAWNEAGGIEEFIQELWTNLSQHDPKFIVIDDCSTDSTVQILQRLKSNGCPIDFFTNPVNMGHGPSTITALRLGLATKEPLIIAIDGDGQFHGKEVAAVIDHATRNAESLDVIEGVRVHRADPIYRKLISKITGALVWLRIHQRPRDANTPFRVYQRSALAILVNHIPVDSLIPNLHISALARQLGMRIKEVPVTSRVRRGEFTTGSSWGTIGQLLPNRRLIEFCIRATTEWFKHAIRK